MKVLISAYACEPGVGSEAAVGWGWVPELSKSHCVHVITRESNRPKIEQELSARPLPDVCFHYFDLPQWMRWWKRGNRGVNLYYILWQVGAYLLARRLHRISRYDLVHHVTFQSARLPSLMGLLGCPFIFGPVGGGEYSRSALWWSLGWRARFMEVLRKASSEWIKFSPLMWLTFHRASRIFATSSQTADCIPARFASRTRVMLAVAITDDVVERLQVKRARPPNDVFRVVYAGRLIYWKGMEHGLGAFARLVAEYPDSELTIVGQGPQRRRWERIALQLGIGNKVRWVPWMDRKEFLNDLPQFDALLFPSLHDSGGMVVLEALSAGLPVVCLDVGGPATMVTDSTGFRIPATSSADVVEGIFRALLVLARDPLTRDEMGRNARAHAAQRYSWATRAVEMRNIYDNCVIQHGSSAMREAGASAVSAVED